MALSTTAAIRCAHLAVKASPLSRQTVFSTPRFSRAACLTSHPVRTKPSESRRSFTRSALHFQNKPSAKATRSTGEQQFDRDVEDRFVEKEWQIENAMRRLIEEAQSGSASGNAHSGYIREKRAQCLAADLVLVQTRREAWEALGARSDLERTTPRFSFYGTGKPQSYLRFNDALDELWFSEVKAWRLYTFSSLPEVGIEEKVWKSLFLVLKSCVYACMRVFLTPAVPLMRWMVNQERKEKDGKR
ncbi:hypothetical protein PRZ48_013388 [Zasmidium cellare]|uniref:Uncharacterized protein n=1 Tax=Zasmidium cellare TaxID=395010 RepID=A0ABR0E0V5_ZASCE|nr:hypothetical protein PRZ48_013388 [Zasmidium cellare]